MNLFQVGDFTLASGEKSTWKIECDALTADDWKGLAAMAAQLLPPFSEVEGVPTGGIPFAEALRSYISPNVRRLLIAEDVVTTGGSMEKFRNGRLAIGVAAFCRNKPPGWVMPVFQLSGEFK